MANRRRVIKIKRQFQDQMILEVVLIAFIFINILVIISFFTLDSMDDLVSLKFTLAAALGLGEVGGLLIIYFHTLRTSHRIAGPIYVLEKRFKELTEGDLSGEVHLRRGDFFHDTAEDYNRAMDSLRERIASARELAQQLRQQGSSADPAQWHELLQQLDSFKLEKRGNEAAEKPQHSIADAPVAQAR
jgi:methyl-accepting chemotaxis protein